VHDDLIKCYLLTAVVLFLNISGCGI